MSIVLTAKCKKLMEYSEGKCLVYQFLAVNMKIQLHSLQLLVYSNWVSCALCFISTEPIRSDHHDGTKNAWSSIKNWMAKKNLPRKIHFSTRTVYKIHWFILYYAKFVLKTAIQIVNKFKKRLFEWNGMYPSKWMWRILKLQRMVEMLCHV